jgi:hypothetical protein
LSPRFELPSDVLGAELAKPRASLGSDPFLNLSLIQAEEHYQVRELSKAPDKVQRFVVQTEVSKVIGGAAQIVRTAAQAFEYVRAAVTRSMAGRCLIERAKARAHNFIVDLEALKVLGGLVRDLHGAEPHQV